MAGIPITRRRALAAAGFGLLGVGVGVSGCTAGAPSAGRDESGESGRMTATTRFGAEWEPHELTVLSWPTARIWGRDVSSVREEIATLAATIAEYEPVLLLASPGEERAAAAACGRGVEVVAMPVDDLWARDTVPVFVEGADGVAGVDLNFNGWGGKQEHANDAGVAAALLDELSLPRVRTRLVAEGGSLETDGRGTLLVTESSIVNGNRNPGWTRDEVEAELTALLGLRSVVWFDGVVGEDITDAHVDSLARFAAPGVVLLDVAAAGAPADVWSRSSEQARSVLAEARDAEGRGFEVVELPQPDYELIRGTGDDFLASYVNFFVGNGAVLVPEFGDRRADDRARGILQEQFADRDVVQLRVDTIASGGGGIHCATHDLPAASTS